MDKNLSQLEKNIKFEFKNKDLLKNVFIHRSYLNENKSFHLASNEKLEFLGDSVLSLITSIFLYKNYPALVEGEYTDIKATIVKTESLAEAARELQLGKYLFLSKGEENGNGRDNTNILADCFEALIAAVFIEHSFNSAYQFVLTHLFKNKLDNIIKNRLFLSPKSKLQEIIQAKFKLLPTYSLIEEKGPEHKRSFKIDVRINGKKLGTGIGKSKKQAEEEAAKNALEKMK